MNEHAHDHKERYLEAPLDPAWLPYSDETVRLAVQLRELDLIDEENVGRLKPDRPSPV